MGNQSTRSSHKLPSEPTNWGPASEALGHHHLPGRQQCADGTFPVACMAQTSHLPNSPVWVSHSAHRRSGDFTRDLSSLDPQPFPRRHELFSVPSRGHRHPSTFCPGRSGEGEGLADCLGPSAQLRPGAHFPNWVFSVTSCFLHIHSTIIYTVFFFVNTHF